MEKVKAPVDPDAALEELRRGVALELGEQALASGSVSRTHVAG